MTASTADAARLREQVVALLASSDRPLSEHEVMRELGPNAIVALHELRREGVIEQDSYRNYVATPEKAADALVAAMEADMQADVDAITAAMAAQMDAETAVALLASQIYELDPTSAQQAMAPHLDPTSAQQAMAPHLDLARRRIADAQRYESGAFAGGFDRARRSRSRALDALTAAANIVDPGATRNDVLRRVVRSSSPAALTAALTTGAIVAAVQAVPRSAPPAPSTRAHETTTGAGGALTAASTTPTATCCGTPVTDGSRPCRCGWSR